MRTRDRGRRTPARHRVGIALAAACGAALLPAPPAHSLPPSSPPFYERFYAGGGVGAAQGAEFDESDLRRPFDAQGLTIQVVEDTDWEFAWHAFLGFQVCRFFALEGGYTSLGSYSSEVQVVEDPGRFVAEASPHAWSVSGLVTTPPWKRLSAFARVGAAFWKADREIHDRLGAGFLAQGDDASGTSVVWGFGGRFDFSKHVGIRGEWERFENVADGDYDVLLASLVFSF